jgi:hypothetical protein
MEGRWTIRWQPFTASSFGGYKLGGREPWPGEDPTPVVPCDDAAVERGARALCEADGGDPDTCRCMSMHRRDAEAVLRAAGESG